MGAGDHEERGGMQILPRFINEAPCLGLNLTQHSNAVFFYLIYFYNWIIINKCKIYTMRIGILGSTCNPPHKDHIQIGEWAKEELQLDRIILVPAKNPPHKDPPKISPETRLAMGKLAIQGQKDWEISDIEFSRPGKSYTEDTIKAFMNLYSQDKIFYIMGADSLASMPWKWRGGYNLLDLCPFIIAPRKGYSLEFVPQEILKKVHVLQKEPTDMSSTDIRMKLEKGGEVSHLVSEGVYKYIKKNNLYSALTAVQKV